MSLTTPIAILPFHFREIVVKYGITKSRLTLSFEAGPSGSYQSAGHFLQQFVTRELDLQGDVGMTDNQIMVRRWQILIVTMQRVMSSL